jgi:integrase
MATDTIFCKHCYARLPSDSLFCNYCGKRVRKVHQDRSLLTVPEPTLLPSGKWRIQLRREGISITSDDRDRCRQEALFARKKWQEDEAAGLHEPPKPYTSLKAALDEYIESRSQLISPATYRGYDNIRNNHFQDCMQWDIENRALPWQMAVNSEAVHSSPKTIKNAWFLCAAAMRFKGVDPPGVLLPRAPRVERPWLDYQQIETFLAAIYGKGELELFCLFGLHSLRLSEILALKPSSIILPAKKILVRGSRVLNNDDELVFKELNKTDGSSRDVPILIDRLTDLLKEMTFDGEFLFNETGKHYYQCINTICRRAGLPEVGVHGLRHSFASLAYHLGWKEISTMQAGGWTNSAVVHRIYTHNSDLDADVLAMQKFYQELKTNKSPDSGATDTEN